MAGQSDTLQYNNMSYIFDVLDRNNDQKINAEDFELFAKAICEQTGVAADSDAGRRLAEAYDAWWDQLRQGLDTNEDGELTKDEFAAGAAERDDVIKKYSERVAGIIAGLIDADNDGHISQDEYVRFSTGISPVDRPTALKAFQQLDVDGDGEISVSELQAGWLQLNSNDSSAPGAAILGQR